MFNSRDYQSDEEYDIGKFLPFIVDVYDVINSPLLLKLRDLPVSSYYRVNKGYRDIDLISNHVYGNPFMAFYIQYYNDVQEEKFPEGTILKMFSIRDFNNLMTNLMGG